MGPGTPIHESEEWQDLVMALGAGLKPQEYIEIEIPRDHKLYKKMKYPIPAFYRLVQRKLKELRLPYDLYTRKDTIYIVGRGVLS